MAVSVSNILLLLAAVCMLQPFDTILLHLQGSCSPQYQHCTSNIPYQGRAACWTVGIKDIRGGQEVRLRHMEALDSTGGAYVV